MADGLFEVDFAAARCSLREDSEQGQAVVRPAAAGGTVAVPVRIG